MEENKDLEKAEIYSKRVRAGKRTYFFDIKSTRSNDFYLTITESKKKFKEDGFFYEKHKIFLYKEDFGKFMEALNETVQHLKTELMPEVDFDKLEEEQNNYYEKQTETLQEENTEKSTSSDLSWD